MKKLQLEITTFCNETCRHCYHPADRTAQQIENLPLLDTMLHEFGELGFIMLIITGGEPLLHPQFKEICNTAQKHRYAISVKTNGTLINDSIVKFFKELRPLNVEISLYSADEKEHDYITCTPGSFAGSLEGIKKLKENAVNVSVMTPVIKGIKNWTGLYPLMKELGVPWSCSPHIHSAFDRREPVNALKNGYVDHLHFIEFIKSHENSVTDSIDDLCFKECGGGETVACIGPDLSLRACITFPEKAGVYTGGNGSELLSEARRQLKNRFALLKCHNCELIKFCDPCPAMRDDCDSDRMEYAKAIKSSISVLTKQ
jgi:MoaA/NifB/PqqE/SkfB family radical SAM enzyme